jgi:outer membrane PBP1 activator LpoA protein
MLHVRLRRGQVHIGPLIAMTLVALCTIAAANAQPAPDDPAVLAQGGHHLEAAARYEKLARRGFFSWDASYGLLAAREYLAAGERDEAVRLADKARGRVRTDEERVLLALVDASLAFDRGEPAAALATLSRAPLSAGTPHEADVLALRGRAEIATGQALAGIRTFERRGTLLTSATSRSENDRLLFDQLLLHPPASTVVLPGTSERERGWLELPVLVVALNSASGNADAAIARKLQDWLAQHPGHPGTPFLPRTGGAAAMFSGAGAGFPIALLLPLNGKAGAAASAVRDGFVAGWFASGTPGARTRVEVYDTSTGAAPAYARAIADGAGIVVGPLLKEEVNAVVAAETSGLPVPTLALNSAMPPGATPPAFLYQFALDPEQEARAVARRIAGDGLVRGVALFPFSPWGRRLHDAFVDELQRIGTVTLMASEYYDPDARDFSDPLRTALGRFAGAGDRSANRSHPAPTRDANSERAAGPQFAFVAATPQAARAIRPQLRFQMTYDLAVYSTSDAWEPSVRAAADMDGLVFPELPWVLYGGQGAPELWSALQDDWASRARGRLRLYAFGYDAFRLAQQLASGASFVTVDGLTGMLELARDDGRVRRGLHFARIDGGRLVAAGASAPAILGDSTTNPPDAPSPQ